MTPVPPARHCRPSGRAPLGERLPELRQSADPESESGRGLLLVDDRPAKHIWMNLVAVDLSFYKSWLSEEIREEVVTKVQAEIRAEVQEEVRAEVQEEVRAEVRAEGRAQDILLVLEQRGPEVSVDMRTRITACDDPEILRRWLVRAVTAPSAEEIFEEG